MKKFDAGHPIVRNRACVIYSDVTLRFLSKEQCNFFINDLIQLDFCPEFKYYERPGESIAPTIYVVKLFDVCWAKNLTEISLLLQDCDYNIGSPVEE